MSPDEQAWGKEPKARVSGASRKAALKRSGGWCVRPGCRSRAVQVHHVLPKGAGKWPEHVNEPANLVGVCELCHVRHERAILRLPREALSPETIEFVIAAGAEWYLLKTYPAQNDDRPGGRPGRSELPRCLCDAVRCAWEAQGQCNRPARGMKH